MLTRIDRVQITAHDAAAVANRWVELLDAQIVRRDRDRRARRRPHRHRRRRLGSRNSATDRHRARSRATSPPAAVRSRPGSRPTTSTACGGGLAEAGIVPTQIGQQFFVDGGRLGIPGLNVVISVDAERPRVGLMSNLYEVTHLTADPAGAAAAHCAAVRSRRSATSCRSARSNSATTAR